MGQTPSIPDRLHRAAKANDVPELQTLCQSLRRTAADSQTRSSCLNHVDLEGRTALQWAAQKNFLAVAQILLDEGADIHKVAPKRPAGGSALAEAVAAKHEAMVELLLHYGADPFTENAAGKAPLDLALELRCVPILRSLERFALFAGVVNMKVLQMKGFSHAAKDRWVVIAPRFTPPNTRSSAIGVVRVMMLIFRNAAEAEPRTKVWLDGATIFRASGSDAVLRLHPNHEQPRNAFTKYDHGWMLFFKQAAAASNAGGTAAAGAAATFASFMVICSRPLDQLQQQQQLRAAGAHAPVDALSSRLAGGSAVSAANPWQQPGQQQQQQQQAHASWPPAHLASAQNPFASNAGGASSTPTHAQPHQAARPPQPSGQQQQQQPYYNAGVQLQAAPAPPAAAQGAGSAGAVDAFALQAAPGESDADFARRLAGMFGGSNASDPRAAESGTTTASGASRTASQTAAQPQAAAAAASLYPAVPGAQPSTQTGAPYPSAPMAPAPAGSAGQQQQAAFADNPFRQGAASGAVAAVAASVQQQPYPPPPAPIAAGVTGSSAVSGTSDAVADADADMCVICLSNAREVGLLHGATLHKCVCRECAGMMVVGAPCPMCRQVIERIIGVF